MTRRTDLYQQRYVSTLPQTHSDSTHIIGSTVCINTDWMAYRRGTWAVSVLTAGLDGTGPRTGRHRRIVTVEETVQEKRQSDDHQEPPYAKGGRGALAGERDKHHQPEADAHQRDARAAMPPGGAHAVAIV